MIGFAATRERIRVALIDEPLAALELLTILRLRRPRILNGETLGRSQAYFPAVGLLLGLIAYGADQLLSAALGAPLTGWILVGLLALLSGCLHLDGLADSVDGFFVGRSPERRLAIMRDSSIGVFGVCALVVVLGVKAASISGIGGLRLEALLLGPALARWAGVVAIVAFPYARESGLGKSFHAGASVRSSALAGMTALGASTVLFGITGLLAFSITSAAALGLGFFISRQIGGLTGDSYGATIESVETGVLLAFAAGTGT